MTKKIKLKSYKRKFNPRLIESNTSYSISEVRELYNICETTARYWLKNGLKIIDGKTPIMVHCEDLRDFLIAKQKAGKKHCCFEEMFCFKCREPRKALEGQAIVINENDKIMHLKSKCVVCEASMTRKYSLGKLSEVRQFFVLSVNCQVNT